MFLLKFIWKTPLLLCGCIIYTSLPQVKRTTYKHQKLFSVYSKMLYKQKGSIFFLQTQIFTTLTGQRKEDYILTLHTSSKL